MFLTKRDNGVWYIIYRDLTGQRKTKTTRTKNKLIAEKIFIVFQNQFLDRQIQKVIPISLKEYRWKFLIYSESIHTTKTQAGFIGTFKRVMNYFGNPQLTELTTIKLEEFIQKRILESSSYAARKDFINLSSALNKAVRDGYLLTNPFSKIKRIKIPERLPLFYSDQDIENLLKVIDNEDVKDFVLFDLNTGLRLGEMASLEWSQIDFEKKFLILTNRSFITKSKRVRTIPLNQIALSIVIKRKAISCDQLVFKFHGLPINQSNFSHTLKRFVLAAKLNPSFNVHTLRHTFASSMVQKGVSIYIVSKLLGHADIKTTQIYAHLRTEDLYNAVKLLEN